MQRFFWLFLVALGLGTKRHWHILFAIVLGVTLGLFFANPEYALLHQFFETMGQIFIRLISMIVIPLIISSLLVGVASLGDGRQLGRLGSKVLGWFIVFMVLASVLGTVLALVAAPGEHVQQQFLEGTGQALIESFQDQVVNPSAEQATAGQAADPLQGSIAPNQELQHLHEPPSLVDLLVNLIPNNPVKSLANMELVPVILFTILFGVAIAWIGDAGRPITNLAESVFAATMKVTDWIMVLSVPGIFSLTFISVAKAGPEIFLELAPYAMAILLGLLIQIVVIIPVVLKVFARVDALNLYRAVSEAIMVAFGTASSSATLPVTIACCERRAGISHRIASFVLPTGASINKTATTMFEVIAVMFLAQAYNIPMEPHVIVLVSVFAIIASIAAPGVPSAGLITMAVVINSIGQDFNPLFGAIAMLWPIDRALDMCRTVVNVLSSCSVATLVAASEGELNRDILNDRESWQDVV